MTAQPRRPLSGYPALEYPFNVIADSEDGYVVVFPDLPGCMTRIDDLGELTAMASDARKAWLETEYDHGAEIPLPSYPEEYSGKFNLRLPKSLRQRLAGAAERDGVSLNQFAVALIAEGIGMRARAERESESRGGDPVRAGKPVAPNDGRAREAGRPRRVAPTGSSHPVEVE